MREFSNLWARKTFYLSTILPSNALAGLADCSMLGFWSLRLRSLKLWAEAKAAGLVPDNDPRFDGVEDFMRSFEVRKRNMLEKRTYVRYNTS